MGKAPSYFPLATKCPQAAAWPDMRLQTLWREGKRGAKQPRRRGRCRQLFSTRRRRGGGSRCCSTTTTLAAVSLVSRLSKTTLKRTSSTRRARRRKLLLNDKDVSLVSSLSKTLQLLDEKMSTRLF